MNMILKNKNIDINYYDVNEILEFYAQYYIIFGQRGNGKSYSVVKNCIDDFFENGNEFVICKRYEEDMKAKLVSTMLDDHVEYIREKYNHELKYWRGKWYVYPCDTEGKLIDCKIMVHGMSISLSEKYKATQYPKVKTIIFEEFMSMNQNFLNNELNLFVNLVSTVFRNRTDCKVFMLGNAIGRVNPYSKALKVRLDKMKHGTIICREFKDNRGYKTTFVIHRCDNVDVFNTKENVNRVVYNIFGDNGVGSMITSGEFETGVFRKECLNITLKNNLPKVKESRYGFYDLIEDVGYEPRIYIIFEGYIYKTIVYNQLNQVVAFQEVEEVDNTYTTVLVNTMEFLPNCINVVNFNSMNFDNNFYLKQLKLVLQLVGQDKMIVESNEDGQNVIDALIQCGLIELKSR